MIALLAAATMFAAPGTYTYAASLSGQPVGQWSVSVRNDAGRTMLDERSSANIGGMSLAATATLTLGTDLAPLRYDGRYSAPAQNVNVSVALSANGATVTSPLAVSSAPLQLAPGTTHFVVVEPGLLAGLFALPAQLAAWRETRVTWITPTSGQAQLLVVASVAPPPRPAGVPSADALLSVAAPIAVSIWYDPATYVPDRIEVPSSKAVLTRVR